MKRIAILFEGSLTDRKGLVNAVLYRAKYLKSISQDLEIDVYNFQGVENAIVRMLRHTPKQERYSSLSIEGFDVKVFWYDSTLLDYLLSVKLKKRPIISRIAYLLKVVAFKNYDLISAHSTNCGLLARAINEQYGIPYYVTWHGSDIHSLPFSREYARTDTISILESASCNFFVSQALCDMADKLTSKIEKMVLYNGVGPSFVRYTDDKRERLRDQFMATGKKVVCFAGNVIDIKNPLVLPSIFEKVKNWYEGNVVFWILGDGKLRPVIEREFSRLGLDYNCWGNISADKMVDYLNCVDVLVLPSKNEGLPLITLEAIKCGAHVVGSDVGGISEAIGVDNVFDLDDCFVEKISQKIVSILSSSGQQSLKSIFNWEYTAQREYDVYMNFFSNK